MHLQIIEPYHGGHHTNYLEALIPALVNALHAGNLQRVTITITSEHYAYLKKEAILALAKHDALIIAPVFPSFSPAPTIADRYRLFEAINDSVSTVKPQHVILPTADYDVMVKMVMRFKLKFGLGTKIKATAIFHYGMPLSLTNGIKEWLKQVVYEYAWKFCRWNTLMLVNPLVYESLVNKSSKMKGDINVLPDPVPAKTERTKADAREYFDLPKKSQLIGYVGMVDARKALPEALAAFESIALQSQAIKMVVIGRLSSQYSKFVTERYQHLIDSGLLIVLDRHLTQHEVQLAYAAIDVSLVLQYRRANLSANLLKAMMNDRPIVADGFGYTGMMIKRFQLGFTCSISDSESISAAMLSAINFSAQCDENPKTTRLKAFHAPENFANMLLRDVVEADVSLPVKTWEWVCEGLPKG